MKQKMFYFLLIIPSDLPACLANPIIYICLSAHSSPNENQAILKPEKKI